MYFPHVTYNKKSGSEWAEAGAAIHHGGSGAHHCPSTDNIRLPPREAFVGTATSTPAEAYYSTLVHELTHFTGHETRCNRELGAAFLCAYRARYDAYCGAAAKGARHAYARTGPIIASSPGARALNPDFSLGAGRDDRRPHG